MTSFELTIPEPAIEEIAQRAAEIVEAHLAKSYPTSPYMTVVEAAEYLRCRPQRVYDLLSARRLPKYKEGSRVLLHRDDLDAHLVCEPAREHVRSANLTKKARQRRNAPGRGTGGQSDAATE